jgi:hypothetical protein
VSVRRRLEDDLAEFDQWEDSPTSKEALACYRKALASGANVVAAKAARRVKTHHLQEFEPDLVAAFNRFMKRPVSTDSGCRAKVDVLDCLIHFGYSDWELYLAAIKHVQLEKVFAVPPVEDTAVNLRANAATGLVNSGYPGVYPILAELLCDTESIPRQAAARSLAHMGGERAHLCMLVRMQSGENDPDVCYELYRGLLETDFQQTLPLVADALEVDGHLVPAALALGETRQLEALAVLTEFWGRNPVQSVRKMLVCPIALNRTDDALDFLLDAVSADDPLAGETQKILAQFFADERCFDRIHHHFQP